MTSFKSERMLSKSARDLTGGISTAGIRRNSSYIMTLYSLAESCEYGPLKEEMIRDRLVVGIRDSGLSERLQMDPDLTLEKAKKSIRQREAVHEQQQALKEENVDAVRQRRPPSDTNRQRSRPNGANRREIENKRSGNNSQPNLRHPQQGGKCTRCGKERHPREKYPARDAQCHNCQRVGHYTSQCRQRTVSTVRRRNC